jgi:hypothetical protein
MKEKNVLINQANKINPKKEKIKRKESIIR